MPKGTHLQSRPAEGEDEGPSSGDAGRLDWGNNDGTGPTMLLRLTRVGDKFTSARSFDNGKTWGRLHDDAHPDTDTVEVKMGDDVLVGIGVSAIHVNLPRANGTTVLHSAVQQDRLQTECLIK